MKNRLKLLRVERNWTQEQLGQALGVSRQAVNALETEKHDPSLDLAYRIAVLFECYGMIVGYLYAKGVKSRLVTVTPPDWQRFIRDELGIKRGEMKHTEWKKHLTQYAKERFKGEGVKGQTADARLILDWWLRHGRHNPTYSK